MTEKRKGRQTPTQSVVLPYYETKGEEAIASYNSSGRTAIPWQELLISDMLAVNDDGLWVHTKYGYSVPRRNGKNEIAVIRELHGLENGERILHTAHRTTTSASAAKRLAAVLNGAGYTEVIRAKQGEKYQKAYTFTKQLGLEKITILDEGGGTCDFRTRSSKGGLGEGFDLLVIDEAQEYTDDQESALKYVVTDSKNPQTIMCGTPPTPVSSGTVFLKLRDATLAGETSNTGWAEWSIESETDPRNKAAWYETNPSLGFHLTERAILDEVGTDDMDFMIQRLGYWIRYSLKSAISEAEWNELKSDKMPDLKGKIFVGIKFGRDGTNAAVAVAVRTQAGTIFVESLDCKSTRSGNGWIIDFLRQADVKTVVVDGANGQQLLSAEMKDAKLKVPILPTVKEIITANAAFEQAIYGETICHMGQPSLAQAVSNCEKRAIGTNGGFGYKALKEEIEIALLDSVILAHWACSISKEKKKQKIGY